MDALERVSGHVVTDIGDLELIVNVGCLDRAQSRVGDGKSVSGIESELAGKDVDGAEGVHLRADAEDTEEVIDVE